MQIKKTWFILSGIAVAIGLIFAFGSNRSNGPQYFTAKADQGEIRNVVDATGTVNAVITVQVGSQVSGIIAKLNADFNSRVHRGDVIALIDSSLIQGSLLQATADLESAEANVEAARANLAKDKAFLVQARADYERTVPLAKENMVTQQQLELAKATYDGASASVDAGVASVTQAKAQVSQKAAAVAVARTILDHTVIRSPINGTVVARNVDVGQTVAASLQAPTIFTIAQDLTKMRVYAKTDESDVGHIKLGQAVTFKVDAFPKEIFRGVVSQIRMNPTVVQNVVTYDTVIDFDNPELKLFPGMTAYVTIPVATVQARLKVPNAALRFKPPLTPDEIRTLYKQYGVELGDGQGTTGAAAGGDESPLPARGPRSETAIVWKLHGDNTIEPVKIALGITDHAYTEVTEVKRGILKVGENLIIRSVVTSAQAPAGQAIRR